jgi:segregation and condensation protein B
MSKKKDGKSNETKNVVNPAEIDTSDLLKALKATHEEPSVSQLAAGAAAFASAFSDDVTTDEVQDYELAKSIESEISEQSVTEEVMTSKSTLSNEAQAFDELNETALALRIATSDELADAEGADNEVTEIEPSSLSTDATEVVEVDELAKDLADAEVKSILESVIFASHAPVTLLNLKNLFTGTNVDQERLSQIITSLQTDYAGGERGVELAEVAGGYQLRTKLENAPWLKRMIKGRIFKLSGPALEVLSIVAYKQPVIKSEVDQIRGVESSHLIRALMEKHLVRFAGKSELPGKPMLYGTTKEFLELFGLRNIRELPTLSEIDELIPEGIGELTDVQDSETLATLGDKLGLPQGKSYSESENELLGISDDLSRISTSSEFFEQEKIRERDRRDQERAQDLRERKIMGDALSDSDAKWLSKFELKIEALAQAAKYKAESEVLAKEQAEAEVIAASEHEVSVTPENENSL